MKCIINGKRYDSDKATEIATWSNRCSCNDFHYCEEKLYQTKSGAFFILGEGGALSRYAQSCGTNSTCGGSNISPMSAEEARDWLEEHRCTDELEKLFGSEIVDA
jgi:hypothetical protein